MPQPYLVSKFLDKIKSRNCDPNPIIPNPWESLPEMELCQANGSYKKIMGIETTSLHYCVLNLQCGLSAAVHHGAGNPRKRQCLPISNQRLAKHVPFLSLQFPSVAYVYMKVPLVVQTGKRTASPSDHIPKLRKTMYITLVTSQSQRMLPR